jgi:hypothetical protein
VPTSISATMRAAAATLLVGLTLALAACSSNPIGPSDQAIGNLPDNFQFQAANLSGTTQTSTYSWTNTGPVAMVNSSGQITGGGGTLILRDASGKQVFSGALTAIGTFPSTGGIAGTWQIEVQLTNVTGTVNFRVQRGT